MNYHMGEGSDWNVETDGIPFDSCEMEENPQAAVIELAKSPATGEPPVLGITGALILMLIAIIVLGKRGRM